MKTAVST